MFDILKKVFGTKNDRELRRLGGILNRVNKLEEGMRQLSDDALKAKTPYFKEQFQKGATLNDILPEVFAVCREASRRVLGKRHFDVQIIGGVVLHEGKIAEMKTGEGKTLTATGAVYLRSLTGRGVHLVTVNEYLATVQAEEMGQLYKWLGLSVGCITSGMDDDEKRKAYEADVTYGTNSEFGFDYLRDNMKRSKEEFFQRDHHFAIVDEVDSILIDEARTPLIISGPSDQTSDKYVICNDVVRGLRRDVEYTVDEKGRNCSLTEAGIKMVEERLKLDNLYNPEHMELVHCVNQALKAHILFRKNEHYVIQQGQVVLVDEFTGRLMAGRRYSEGLHQAIEAKENVSIQRENQTLASVTYQNYFRMYDTLSGMTGTADTEAVEFHKIYSLDVVVIPTNRPMIRKDHDDVLFFSAKDKFNAVVEEIDRVHKKGQPVLVGTVSIEKSELLSQLLTKKNIPHHILNAKNHENEAEIIAQAGQKNRVTISTNMAGRGTDIVLGEGVADVGGLYVIGTERHESRRIDNQLRGRSGRQGDAGESKFFLSWEDDLLRRFNTKANSIIMGKVMGSEAVESRMLTNVIENTQKRVEGFHYDVRKHLLEYDNVLDKQRRTIYAARNRILDKGDIHHLLFPDSLIAVCQKMIDQFIPPTGVPGELLDIDFTALERFVGQRIATLIRFPENARNKQLTRQELLEELVKLMEDAYTQREELFGKDQMKEVEGWIMLQIIDSYWKDHLLSNDHLKDSIGLRGYGQKDPLQEYKREAFDMFKRLVSAIKEDTVENIYKVRLELTNSAQEEQPQSLPKGKAQNDQGQSPQT